MSTVGTRWYTLAEAAPVLGVSIDTVRRRLKRGDLEGRQVHTQHGPTWEVCLGNASTEVGAAAQGAAQPAQGGAEGETDAGVVQLVVLVDRLQRENRDLAGQVGFLSAQLAATTERLVLMEAMMVPEQPQDPTVDASAAPEPPAVATESTPPWWRRWRLWLAAGAASVIVGAASCQAAPAVTKDPALCAAAHHVLDDTADVMMKSNFPASIAPTGAGIDGLVNVIARVC